MQKRRVFGKRKTTATTIGNYADNDNRQLPSYLDRRRGERRPLWCEAYVYNDHQGQPRSRDVKRGVLLDLNEYGIRVRFRTRALCSKRIFVTVTRLGLRRPGRVIWQKGFDVGIKFD